MSKIYLVVEEYVEDYNVETRITPCATPELAVRTYEDRVEADVVNFPDTIRCRNASYYANYEEGEYLENHSIIEIRELEVIDH